MPQLVSLAEFYKIAGWKTWGAGFKKNHDTVHDAVHVRPDMALQELASYLGVRIFQSQRDNRKNGTQDSGTDTY